MPSLNGLALGPTEHGILPLRALGLVFEAGGRRLIDGVDLAVEATGRTVVLGPNGAGKSLLLRLLHGLISPTRGAVRWSGGYTEREVVQRQALVFQRPVLLRRSVRANLRYALAARGLARREQDRRIEEVLAAAHLEHLVDRPARVLSGGEQQRLAMARALSLHPQILFLDEPTASLDPASTLAIEELVLEADAIGTKVLLVTHDLGQARRLADEVVFLHRGRVAEQTAAERFFESPHSEPARDFLAGKIVV